MPSGTTGNEATHYVLNKAYRNLPEIYSSTLGIQVSLLQYTRLKAHTSALSDPTLAQVRHRDVRALAQASVRFSPADWIEMTSRTIVDTESLRQKKHVKAKIRAVGAFIKKRPAAATKTRRLTLRLGSSPKPAVKRTVFTLKRVNHTG
jgi:hypothetical protein